MRLAHDWSAILRRAWSMRLMALALLFVALDVAWPLLDGLVPVPQVAFACLSGLFTAGGLLARLVVQNNLSEPTK